MDNLLFYRPLWEEEALIFDSSKHIEKLRLKSIGILLHKLPVDVNPPSVEAVITSSIHIIKTLLEDVSDDNAILQKIRNHATEVGVDPNLVVRGAIVLWYSSVLPILSRDPDQGLPHHAIVAGGLALPWVQKLAENQYFIGNLGYLSMLLTAEDWEKPTHPKLQVATLITNAMVSIIYAAFVITPHLNANLKWRELLMKSGSRGGYELRVFLKTYWHASREGWEKLNYPPGSEFSALECEARMSPDGKKLLTRVGQGNWHEAPFWHPFRTVPGSPWNKFIKNKKQKVFPVLPRRGNSVRYMVPGSATGLIGSCETYYGILRSQFDDTETPRVEVSDAERIEQFKRLAEGTGLEYPKTRPVVENSMIRDYSGAEHMYNVPTIKKNASDLSGNLTLPFLTTTARAMRFTEEPDFVDEDFHAMVFFQ